MPLVSLFGPDCGIQNIETVNRRRILFVDDSAEFLASIRDLMLHLSEGTWDVLTAEGAGPALGLLQQQAVDLIVVDIEMPVVDGIQFLQLLQRKYPNTPRTALTSHATEARRAACLSAGAEFCLEKPVKPEEQRQLYATLNELAHPQAEEGFRGVLRRVGLTDVIQMECLARNSSVLEVTATSARGEIYIKTGSIIHAWCGPLRGEEAFDHLLGLGGGQFMLRPFIAPAEQTIRGSWEFLLMEAARKRDEARQAALALESPPVEPAPAAAAPEEDLAVPEMTSYLPTEKEQVQPVIARAPATRIEEVVLCSAQGDVLYEWQSSSSDARVGFMEFLSQKAWQLGMTLPLGDFERIEIQGHGSRVVTQIQADRGLFVRSSQPQSSS